MSRPGSTPPRSCSAPWSGAYAVSAAPTSTSRCSTRRSSSRGRCSSATSTPRSSTPGSQTAITRSPYGVFRCAGGDRLLVAVHNDAEWRRVADRLLGRAELADDPRYATSVARLEHRHEVDALTADALGALSKPEATRLLDEIRVAYGSVHD